MSASTQPTTLFGLAVVKNWLKVTDNSQDDRIVLIADAVSQRMESVTNRVFVTRSLSETHDGDGSRRLLLRKAPVIAVASLAIKSTPDSTPVSYAQNTDFDVDVRLGRLQMRSVAIARGFQNVAITYTAGFGAQDAATLPDDVYQAGLDYVKVVYAEWSSNAIAASTVSIGPSTMVLKPDLPVGIKAVLNQWKWKHL